jgi:hypothetical protein
LRDRTRFRCSSISSRIVNLPSALGMQARFQNRPDDFCEPVAAERASVASGRVCDECGHQWILESENPPIALGKASVNTLEQERY